MYWEKAGGQTSRCMVAASRVYRRCSVDLISSRQTRCYPPSASVYLDNDLIAISAKFLHSVLIVLGLSQLDQYFAISVWLQTSTGISFQQIGLLFYYTTFQFVVTNLWNYEELILLQYSTVTA